MAAILLLLPRMALATDPNKVGAKDKDKERENMEPIPKNLAPEVSAKIMLVKIKVKTKVRTRALTKALIQAKTKVKSKGKMRQPDLKRIDLILTTRQLVYLKVAKKLAIPLYASLDISKLRSLLSEISPILHRLQDFFKHRVALIFHPTLCS